MDLTEGILSHAIVPLVAGVRKQIVPVAGVVKHVITGTGGAEYVGSSTVDTATSGPEVGLLLSESATEFVTLVVPVVSDKVKDIWFLSDANGNVEITQYGQ